MWYLEEEKQIEVLLGPPVKRESDGLASCGKLVSWDESLVGGDMWRFRPLMKCGANFVFLKNSVLLGKSG